MLKKKITAKKVIDNNDHFDIWLVILRKVLCRCQKWSISYSGYVRVEVWLGYMKIYVHFTIENIYKK